MELLYGIIIGIAIMIVLNFLDITGNTTIASANGKSIKRNEIFKKMKDYTLNFILEESDEIMLNSLYTLTEQQLKEIEEEATKYIDTYKTYYGYTEEQVLEENGFGSLDEFKKVVKLNYLRDLYYKDYLETVIPEEDIKDYYESNVFGAIDSKHILLKISEDLSDEEALKKANEIIKELENGLTFDEAVEKYKDDIIFEELGYQGFNASIEVAYMTALKELKDGEYTKTPVKTSYGYHIIYRIAQNEKPTLEESKKDFIETLAKDLEEKDKNLYSKALLNLREKYEFEIYDETIKNKYKTYCESLQKSEEE